MAELNNTRVEIYGRRKIYTACISISFAFRINIAVLKTRFSSPTGKERRAFRVARNLRWVSAALRYRNFLVKRLDKKLSVVSFISRTQGFLFLQTPWRRVESNFAMGIKAKGRLVFWKLRVVNSGQLKFTTTLYESFFLFRCRNDASSAGQHPPADYTSQFPRWLTAMFV